MAERPLRGPLRKRDSQLWARHPQDWYVEPEWCSLRLFEKEKFTGQVWDPACGRGTIVIAALKSGLVAVGSDIEHRGWDSTRTPYNFLDVRGARFDNIVCNPPYGYIADICEKFVQHALTIASNKVAMILPANWVQGDKRSRWMASTPLSVVYFICPRPSMPPGPVIEAGIAPGNGTTDYAWYVWEQGYTRQPRLDWIRRD